MVSMSTEEEKMESNYVLLFRALPSSPACRRCAQPIDRADRLGLSERVCGTCRGESRGRPERRLFRTG
jgi:hypothetical protein